MTYTLEAGRLIVRDDVPFVTIHGVGQYVPTEADAFARQVVKQANAYPKLVEALRRCAEADRDDYDAASAAETLLRELGEDA